MQLNIGNVKTIDSPADEDIAFYLKFMPVQSPFISLRDNDNSELRAFYDGVYYQFVYHSDGVTRRRHGDYELANGLFSCFLREGLFSDSSEWKTETVWNKQRSIPYEIILLILILMMAIPIWKAIERLIELR